MGCKGSKAKASESTSTPAKSTLLDAPAEKSEGKKKVLIVSTSASKMGDKDTGLWSEECCGPYYVFTDAGCEVTVCSIGGGDIPVDAGSLSNDFQTENDKRMEADGSGPLKGTPKLADQDITLFDIVFFSGGHGTCVDFPTDEVGSVVGKAMSAGKVVAAVCHGPMALVKADVVKGKKVACFSNKEEQMVGLTEKVPFLLEDKMKELGATLQIGDPWSNTAVRDGNLVTGQNPQSSVAVAKLCLEASPVEAKEPVQNVAPQSNAEQKAPAEASPEMAAVVPATPAAPSMDASLISVWHGTATATQEATVKVDSEVPVEPQLDEATSEMKSTGCGICG